MCTVLRVQRRADFDYYDASSKMNEMITSITFFSKCLWIDLYLFSKTTYIPLKHNWAEYDYMERNHVQREKENAFYNLRRGEYIGDT